MGEFTKGPWVVVETDGADFTAISSNDGEVLGASEWLRCSNEDLHLMAAAPDLLEALESILATRIQEKGAWNWKPGESPLHDRCRAAIARARGEA